MGEEVVYHLEVNGRGTHNSFEYKTMREVQQAYEFLFNKFSDDQILDKNSAIRTGTKIVQLSISEVYIGSVPSNAMASFVLEDWFNEDVYEDMLKAAEQYKKEKE